MSVLVKICGITNPEDASLAVRAGADALGFVFWKKSPRRVSPAAASDIIKELPPFVTTVGVFVNETPDGIRDIVREAGLDRVQLHGDEGPSLCDEIGAVSGVRVIKAFRVGPDFDIMPLTQYRASAFLLDAYKPGVPGGTGESFDWNIAASASKTGRIILSGGLTPDNVAEAARRVRPYAVDVSSGVEAAPGKKDAEKVRRFVERAKGAGR
ncbi:MAG: phosphoribosylanthranilate isomerase [Deltaproteobacteria bacterium]|nr:phosphoribosylanthranilate isomerase [Deltaproteobacteria bacterium]